MTRPPAGGGHPAGGRRVRQLGSCSGGHALTRMLVALAWGFFVLASTIPPKWWEVGPMRSTSASNGNRRAVDDRRLRERYQGSKHKIITIEDPIEYEVANVTQIAVHEKIGLTRALPGFKECWRSRARPDADRGRPAPLPPGEASGPGDRMATS